MSLNRKPHKKRKIFGRAVDKQLPYLSFSLLCSGRFISGLDCGFLTIRNCCLLEWGDRSTVVKRLMVRCVCDHV